MQVPLIKNSLFILFSRGIQIASSFLILVAVARYLTVEQYGEYTFIIAFVSSVMSLTYFGIQQVLIREIAKNKDNACHLIGSAIQLRTSLSVVAILVLLASMIFMRLTWVAAAGVVIVIVSEFFLAFTMLTKAVFQAFEKMVFEPVVALIYSLILLISIGAAIYLNTGFLGFLVATAVSNVIQFGIVARILSTRFVRPVFNADKGALWRFFRDSSVIGLGVFFYQNLFRINVMTLKWFGKIEDVAFFQVPHNFIMQIGLLPAAFVAAFFPVFSRMIHHEPARAVDIYEKAFKYLFVFSLISAISLSLFSSEIIDVLFGSKYANSANALILVSWAMIPLSIDMLSNSVLISMNKQRYSVIYGGAILGITFLAGSYFIPLYGYSAAACLALISYSLLSLFSLYFISRNGFPLVLDKIISKTLLAGLTGGIVIFSLKPISISLAAFFGLFIYFIVLLATRVFPASEFISFRGVADRIYFKGGSRHNGQT